MSNIKYIIIFLLFSISTVTAKKNLDSLYSIWENEDLPDTTRVETFAKYIIEGFLFSNPDSAIVLSQKSYEFAKKYNNEAAVGRAKLIQGLAYWLKGEYPSALENYQISLDNYLKVGDKKGSSMVMGNIGVIWSDQGEYKKALSFYQRSLKLKKELKDTISQIPTLNNIGLMYYRQGDYERATKYFKESLALNKNNAKQKDKANAFVNLGNVFKSKKDYNKALEFYRKSLKVRRQIKDQFGIASSVINIGTIFQLWGNNSKAIKECYEGLQIANKLESMEIQQEACDCLYNAYKANGNTDKALYYHELMISRKDSLRSQETSKKLQQMEFQKKMLADSLKQEEEKLKIEMAHQEEIAESNRTRNILIGSGALLFVAILLLYNRNRYIRKSRNEIARERDRSDNLLLNILPSEIAEELKEKGKADARDYENVSILFTDFKEFTKTSARLSAKELVKELNECFKAFDKICVEYDIEKIKTIGDSYMAAGGVPIQSKDSVKRTLLAGLAMIDYINERSKDKKEPGEIFFRMRAGIHTGPVVAGIVGLNKFQYDIWGDSVNTASRMESAAEAGKLNISQSTYDFLKDDPDFEFESRGKIMTKGKGELEMYYVSRKKKITSENQK